MRQPVLFRLRWVVDLVFVSVSVQIFPRYRFPQAHEGIQNYMFASKAVFGIRTPFTLGSSYGAQTTTASDVSGEDGACEVKHTNDRSCTTAFALEGFAQLLCAIDAENLLFC